MDPQNTEPVPKLRIKPRPWWRRRPRWLRSQPRRLARPTGIYLAMIVASILVAGGGYAVAASSSSAGRIHACVNKRTGALTIRAKCARGTRPLVWNEQGPQGKPGVTTTRMVPSGWTLDFVSESGLYDAGKSDGFLSTDSHGIASVSVVATGEYQVVATGCHNQTPMVQTQADPLPGVNGYVAQADALVWNGSSFQSLQDARPNGQGNETFDVFTYVPDPSAKYSVAGGYIPDADLVADDFTFLIYC